MNGPLSKSSENNTVLVLQHAQSDILGTIEDALKAVGVSFEYLRAFEDQPVPNEVGRSSGLIIMGGPMGVYETDQFPFLLQELRLIERFLKAPKPILLVFVWEANCLPRRLVCGSKRTAEGNW